MKKQPLIITIAALVLLAGVAYLAGSINSDKDKVAANNSNAAQTKEYSNSEAGYSLKYPSDWTYSDSSSGNPAMFYDPISKKQTVVTELLQGSKIEIYYESTNGKSLQTLVSEKDQEFQKYSENDISVNGVPAVRRTLKNASQTYTNVVYLISKEKLISIVQYIPVDAEINKYGRVFDDVIASFTLN